MEIKSIVGLKFCNRGVGLFFDGFADINRCASSKYQCFGWNFGDNGTMLRYPQEIVACYTADNDSKHIPFAVDLHDLLFKSLFGYNQHPFLRFGEHYFVGTHARFANRDKVKIDLYAA